MAIATNSTPGTVVLAGDLAGTHYAPALRSTGVQAGVYNMAVGNVIDSKGRFIWTRGSATYQDIVEYVPTATNTTQGIFTATSPVAISGGKVTLGNASKNDLGVVSATNSITISAGVMNVIPATASLAGVVSGSSSFQFSSGAISLKAATASVLGGVKVGDTLAITAGVLSIPPATGGDHGVVKGNLTYAQGLLGDAFTGVWVNPTSHIMFASTMAGSQMGMVTGSPTYFSFGLDGALSLINIARITGGTTTYAKRNFFPILLSSTPAFTSDSSAVSPNVVTLTTSTAPTVSNPTTVPDYLPFFITTNSTTYTGSATGGYMDVMFRDAVSTGTPTGLITTAATGPYRTVNVGGNKTLSSSTGLSAATDTSGYRIIAVGSNKVAGSSTGYGSTLGTVGYADINVGGNKTTASTVTGFSQTALQRTYGTINVGGAKTGSSPTGLSSSAWYAFKVTIEGTSDTFVFPGSNAQTYDQLITVINAGFGDAPNSYQAGYIYNGIKHSVRASLVSGNLRLTNEGVTLSNDRSYTHTVTIGAPSVAEVQSAQGVTVSDMSAALTGFTSISNVAPTIPTFYTVIINGTTFYIRGDKITSLTYGGLIAAMNDFSSCPTGVLLNGSPVYQQCGLSVGTQMFTAGMSGGNLRISSQFGVLPTITVAAWFSTNLTGYVGLGSSSAGTTPATYAWNITIDGSLRAFTLLGVNAQTYGDLITQINNNISAYGTAALVNGDIKITSNTQGSSSSVSAISGAGVTSLSGYQNVLTNAVGTLATSYTATTVVDGITTNVTLFGYQCQTFGQLISKIGAAITSGGNANITMASGNIRVYCTNTAATSISVSGTVWASLTGYTSISSQVAGTTATAYSCVLLVDGAFTDTISFTGDQAVTYNDLVAVINGNGALHVTASIKHGRLRFTSKTTGLSSSVVVSTIGFISSLAGYIYDTGGSYQQSKITGGTKYSSTWGTDYKFSNDPPNNTRIQVARCFKIGSTAYCTYI